MPRGLDAAFAVAGVVALASSVWTVEAGVATAAESLPAVLVPALFVLAGLLGPLWHAAAFTCRLLLALGGLHLLALALSTVAQSGTTATAWWQLASQMLYLGGFGLLVPLAAGYPGGPASRLRWSIPAAACALPLLAAFAAPTPPVLSGRRSVLLGPVAPLLPAWLAAVPAVAFLLPVVAVGIAVLRVVHGGRETRGRLALPLAALAAFAVLVGVSGLLPATWASASTAVFLVSAPLVPVGLVSGSRALREPLDAPLRTATPAALAQLSPREREVLAAMADGDSNAAIGRRLHISLSAVEKHTTAIFAKLDLDQDAGTHRRVAAVVAYLRAAAD